MRGEAAFFLSVTLLIILFHGSPDIVDAIIQFLTAAAECK